MTEDNLPFDQIAATISSPMVIATTVADDRAGGCLVGFSTQCSIEPLRYLVCLSVANRTYEVACAARTIVVHLLHADPHDRALAHLFGEETAYHTDKFAECDWSSGPDGVPVLAGCDWFAGTIVDRIPLGDHEGFVVEVIRDGSATRAAEPYLTFPDVRAFDAGNPAD